MARGRWLSPDFFDSTTLARCSHSARLLFAALLQCADRAGVFEWDELKLRKYAFGYDDITQASFDKWLRELWVGGFILRAEWIGKLYGFIPTMPKRQQFHKDEKPKHTEIANGATWSAPCSHGAGTVPLTLRSEIGDLRSETGDLSLDLPPQKIADAAEVEIATRSETKPKKPKTPTAPTADADGYIELVGLWFTSYEKRYGAKPAWGAVYGRQLKNLLARSSVEELRDVIPKFFAWKRPEVIKGGHSLSTGNACLLLKLDELRADILAPERRAFAAVVADVERNDERHAQVDGQTQRVFKILEDEEHERLGRPGNTQQLGDGTPANQNGREDQAAVRDPRPEIIGRGEGALAPAAAPIRGRQGGLSRA